MADIPNRPDDANGGNTQRKMRWPDRSELDGLANDAGEHLGRFGRNVAAFNARAAEWVTELTWKRVALLTLALFIAAQIIGDITGFDTPTVRIDPNELNKPIDIVVHSDAQKVRIQPSVGGKPTRPVDVQIPDIIDTPAGDSEKSHGIVIEKEGKRIVIDDRGVRVLSGKAAQRDAEKKAADHGDADTKASGDAKPESAMTKDAPHGAGAKPEGADAVTGKEPSTLTAMETAAAKKQFADDMRLKVQRAIEDSKDEVQSAVSDEIRAAVRRSSPKSRNFLWEFVKALLVVTVVYLIILKATTNTKRRAAVAVQSAEEVADRESLKRQVSEAKMQMMQAQVEPHFLFNTLASIDHLIETDPARASTMQKNLIQYLRAVLPQMRENATDLGREVDLVRAYLDILKVRMEERLQVSFAVPDGLRSADFPPMMLQSLVENAIKHGLEPKAEGGRIDVSAEIAHGDLLVCVADTGLGFSASGASTSGTGLGLSNIRERLKLLHGERGGLVIEANEVEGAPLGTRVTVSVPYQSRRAESAAVA